MATKTIQTNKHIEEQEMEEKTIPCKQSWIIVKRNCRTKIVYYSWIYSDTDIHCTHLNHLVSTLTPKNPLSLKGTTENLSWYCRSHFRKDVCEILKQDVDW